jgi:lipoteichoic acid synthase
MMAAGLLAVFIAAKLAAWSARAVPVSAVTLVAALWQDLAVALAFALFSRVVRPRWIVGGVYAVLVAVVVASVPVERTLGSPITLSMLRAASGTIGDSFLHAATAANVAWMLVVVAIAVLPLAFSRPALKTRVSGAITPSLRTAALGVTVMMTLAGFAAARRVETAGLDRNALVALAQSTVDRVSANGAATSQAWRVSPVAPGTSDDLSHLAGAAAGRNVLMIVLESTAARYLKAYGAAEDPTPTISALAGRALLFEHAYSVYPESVRGMTALYASRFPAFDVPNSRHTAAMAPSLASVLAGEGYATGLFHSGRFMYLAMDELLARAGFDTLVDAGGVSGNVNSSFGVDEAATVEAMLQWMDARPSRKPFFLAYMPTAGHHPYFHAARGPWRDTSDFTRYLNAIHEGDAAIGTLVRGLGARGLDSTTMIVVLGDHGEAFGQHPGNFAHTLAIYDENVRVPLFFVLPGSVSLAHRVSRVASLVDVPPTVLDLLGVARPAAFQGESLLGPSERMALYFTDYSRGLLGLRDGCTSYFYEMETRRSRMFDVCKDPDQRQDIGDGHRDLGERYRDLLNRWSAAQVALVGRTAGR